MLSIGEASKETIFANPAVSCSHASRSCPRRPRKRVFSRSSSTNWTFAELDVQRIANRDYGDRPKRGRGQESPMNVSEVTTRGQLMLRFASRDNRAVAIGRQETIR